MQRQDYDQFTQQLTHHVQTIEQVQALILAGSTANKSHAPDEWSDHDFFLITTTGAQEHFRTHFDWLPDHESIVLAVRETQHGLKILLSKTNHNRRSCRRLMAHDKRV